jgi:RNA polymerase sigma factor (sigma-70 family)
LRFAYLLAGRNAEDLVQEAFLIAYAKWDRSLAVETFWPWVQTTLIRLNSGLLRRAGRELRALGRLAGSREEVPQPEPRFEVMSALDRLSSRQRAAVVLRYFEDLPEAQVADRLGVRLGTAKALLHQARRRLQIELSRGSDED